MKQAICLLIAVGLVMAPACKRRRARQAPAYGAAVKLWDGPNACQPATSFVGSFLGGQICQTPAPVASAPGATRIDFNFGGLVKTVTPSTFVHGYSLPVPFSATNRFIALNDTNGYHFALDQVTGKMIGIPGTANTPIWDSATDELFYYPIGTEWHRFNVLTGENLLIADVGFAVHQISNGGSTHVSSDMWTAFYDPNTSMICAIELRAPRTYCANFRNAEVTSRVGYDFIDYTVASDIDRATGQRYILLMASPALAAFTVDTAQGVLRFAYRGGENPAYQSFNQSPQANGDGHCDPGEACLNAPHGDATNIDGIQYFITSVDTSYDPCERDLVALKLSDGEAMVPRRYTILPLAYCSSPWEWPNIHVGCSPRTGACAISTDTFNPAPYGNQLLYMPDLSHVYKMAYHQSSARGSDTYWRYARSAMSWDGRFILFDSNSGQADQGNGFAHEQVFVIPTSDARGR